MRVAFITPEYPPAERMGGIGTNTATVARGLVRAGHDVFVAARGPAGRWDDEGVSVVRLAPSRFALTDAARLLARRQIARAALEFRPDVVQAPEYEAEAWWVARRGRVPLVTRLATPTYLVEQMNRGEPDPRSDLIRRLERDQASRSAAVFAPSRALADRVAADWELPVDLVRVIASPVDADGIRRAAGREPPVELPARYLAFVGRLERRKGIEPLGAALPVALGAHPDVHAVVVGRDPGEDRGVLMERFRRAVEPVRDRVHLLGEVSREDALAVAARAELVVLPSLWENLANACLEAMALGRPVVATDAGGFPEVIEHGKHGWLVPPGDAEALAATLTEALGDPAARERVGRAAAQRAGDFTVEKVVDELSLLYEEVASSGRIDASIYRSGYRRYFRPEVSGDPFRKLYEAKRNAVTSHFSGSKRRRILDVGGGFGRVTGPLADEHEVTLCDLSPEMLEEARRLWPGLRLVECDARNLPFDDGEFDAAVALDLLPHVGDLNAGLGELSRVVGAGGEVVFDTTNAAALWVLGYPSYVNWRPHRLLETLRGNGVLPEWREIVRHHYADDVRAAIDRADLEVRDLQTFGPRWSPKWHLWWTVKR